MYNEDYFAGFISLLPICTATQELMLSITEQPSDTLGVLNLVNLMMRPRENTHFIWDWQHSLVRAFTTLENW